MNPTGFPAAAICKELPGQLRTFRLHSTEHPYVSHGSLLAINSAHQSNSGSMARRMLTVSIIVLHMTALDSTHVQIATGSLPVTVIGRA